MGEQAQGEDAGSAAEDVVRRFCAAVAGLDREALRPFLSDDVVYHNMPMEPAQGVDATMAVLEMFFGMCEAIEFRIDHIAARADVVLTERVDFLTIAGRRAPVPVMGAFEVVDGRIKAWRDYFDMAQVTAALTPG